MRPEYKRDMNHNYMILHKEGDIDTDSYQVRMLVGNVIPSFLKCRIQGVDGNFLVYYDITSRQSLLSYYEDKKLGYKELKLIFGGFVRVMEDTAEYLVSPGQIILLPEYMYLEPEKEEMYFCFFPGYDHDIREQFQKLTEYFLPRIDHDDEQAVRLGYGIYRKGMEDHFHLEDIKEELYKESTAQDQAGGEKESIFIGVKSGSSTEQGQMPEYDSAEEDLWKTEEGISGKTTRKKKTEKNCRKNRTSPKSFERKKHAQKKDSAAKKGKVLKQILFSFTASLVIVGMAAGRFLGYLPDVGVDIFLAVTAAAVTVLLPVYVLYSRKLKSGQKQRKDLKMREAKSSEEDFLNEKELYAERELYTEKELYSGKEMYAEKEPNIGQELFTEKEPYDNNLNFQKQYEENRYINSTSERTNESIYERSQNSRRISAEKESGRSRKAAKETGKNALCGETVVLSEADLKGPASFVSREPGELAAIYLKEEIMVIGKLETACDAVIDLPTVSRIHAKVRRRDGEYYLSDLNSRNGTAVNGRMLKSEEEYQLQDEDAVDFAQARYIFLK